MKTYPASVEDKLGFDVVRERLSNRLMCALGQERLDGMRPARTLDWLRAELERVEELQDAFRYGDPVPIHHLNDIRSVLKRAAPEDAYVDPQDLWDVRQVLITLRRIKRYFDDHNTDYPRLAYAVERITPLPDVEDHIASIVDPDGKVRDDASPELSRLRRLILRRESELRDTLDRELRKAVGQGYATEGQPTIRGGRMVIPIRAEAKRKVEGFVHDTSATGQTVYIEPAACLALNNEVRELKSDEQREVERILREATGLLRANRDVLDTNMKSLAQFDLLQAKARLSNHLEAVVPNLNEEGHIDIHEGRNPVLQLHFERQNEASGDSANALGREDGPRSVVPLDLSLGGDFNTLVITGPNAGGKTVAMKTVGLFGLMLAYGLPIPVAPHSHFALFEHLIVDIGDEQSIEEDLSTFSSHVSNLRHMLRHAGSGSLVLIDEAGTGTDPEEGGALAQAVLERLSDAGARTIATTHHGTLKVYAHETEGVENGSMEFNQTTLQPTYRYQQGVPGSSYAFEIAQRMGLNEDLLARARELAGAQKTAMEQLISTFEGRNQELQERLDEARAAQRKAEQERDTFEGKRRKLEKERDQIRQQALEEAERIVQGANARIERTIREIKEAQAEKEATRKAREAFEDFREEVSEERELVEDELESEADAQEATPQPASSSDGAAREPERPKPSGPIREGDQVVVDDGSTAMEVQEIDDGEAVVIMGSMHMRVKLDRLTKVGGPRREPARGTSYSSDYSSSTSGIAALRAQQQIDLRGQRVEEALSAVRQFLDDAIAADLHRVRILHGKGTGALREAIHETLSAREDVAYFDQAPLEEGGAGVTVVDLA